MIKRLEVLMVVVLVGCGGGESSHWAGTIADSAGVPVVQNTEQGLWAAQSVPAVTEDLRIGQAEGDPDYQFGQIASIAVGSDSSIYVLDQQGRQVRVYDASGKYVRSIGRGGNGPGELSQTVTSVLVGAGDTIYIPDLGLQRLNRFTSTGEYLNSFPIPMVEGLAMKWAILPDQRLIEQARRLSLPGQPAMETKDYLLVRTTSGVVVDTIMELPAGQTVSFSGSTPRIRLFEAEPIWTLAKDGRLLFGVNTDYRIEVHGLDGRLERVIRKPFQRQPVTDADTAAFRKMLRETYRRSGIPPMAIPQVMSVVQFADYYPAFANLLTGPNGTLWAQRVKTASSVGKGVEFDARDVGSPEWEVFDREGRYLGVVKLPDRFVPVDVEGDHIYGVWRDDLDVQYVVRLKVGSGEGMAVG